MFICGMRFAHRRAMFNFERIALAGALGAGLSLIPVTLAFAQGNFDPTKGKVVLDEAAYALSFDGPNSLSTLGNNAAFNGDFDTVRVPATEWLAEPTTAIEGEGVLRMGRGVSAVYLGLGNTAETLRGRRVVFTVWTRPQGALPIAEVFFTPRSLAEADQTDFFRPIGQARLQPTGRATSDGWRELSTGPIDFSMHGAVEARFIQIIDQRLSERTVFGVPSNNDGAFLIDGLSIHDVGERAVPDVACSLVDEATTCGDAGACVLGRCIDAYAALGTPPTVGIVRTQYLERLAFRISMAAGARFSQAEAPRFSATLSELSTEERGATYWSRYFRAFDDLGDGHVSAPGWRFRISLTSGMCLNQGVADLLPTTTSASLAPMVFGTDTTHPVAANLQEGDILVAIDGVPPYEWLARADRYLRYSGDPAGRTFVATEQLPTAALSTGAALTFARCQGTNGATCSADQVETFTVDLSDLVAPLWQGQALGWGDDPVCDFRFRRDIPFDANFASGEFVGFRDSDDGALRSILLNGVSGRRNWTLRLAESLTNLPGLVLLDQRTGNGGTFGGVIAALEPFWPVGPQPLVELVPQLRPELDDRTLAIFISCLQNRAISCGNFSIRPLLEENPRQGIGANARLAIVNGRDVSGNDFLPKALVDRPNPETRVFGGVPTFGAFGPILTMPRMMQEVSGGSIQLQDSIFIPSLAQQNYVFTTGIGVPPDEVVLQRQSDAVQGIDTVLEAAKTWLRGGQP